MTPIIAITMGDATGIGPEVIVKALSHPEVYKECRPVVIGDTKRLQQAQRITKSDVEINTIASESITHTNCQPGNQEKNAVLGQHSKAECTTDGDPPARVPGLDQPGQEICG